MVSVIKVTTEEIVKEKIVVFMKNIMPVATTSILRHYTCEKLNVSVRISDNFESIYVLVKVPAGVLHGNYWAFALVLHDLLELPPSPVYIVRA